MAQENDALQSSSIEGFKANRIDGPPLRFDPSYGLFIEIEENRLGADFAVLLLEECRLKVRVAWKFESSSLLIIDPRHQLT